MQGELRKGRRDLVNGGSGERGTGGGGGQGQGRGGSGTGAGGAHALPSRRDSDQTSSLREQTVAAVQAAARASHATTHQALPLIDLATSAATETSQTLTYIKPRHTFVSDAGVGLGGGGVGKGVSPSPGGRARSSERGGVARKIDGVGLVQGWLKGLGVEDKVCAAFQREDMDVEAVLLCAHDDFVRIGLEDKRLQDQLVAQAWADRTGLRAQNPLQFKSL